MIKFWIFFLRIEFKWWIENRLIKNWVSSLNLIEPFLQTIGVLFNLSSTIKSKYLAFLVHDYETRDAYDLFSQRLKNFKSLGIRPRYRQEGDILHHFIKSLHKKITVWS